MREKNNLPFGPSVALVAVISSVILIGTATATGIKPTPSPQVLAAAPKMMPPHLRSSECPQMDNPGGRLRWEPSADAGPSGTDGVVSIPKLGASAPIVKVGVNTDGAMVVPRTARDVAWLDQGGFPGKTRNAVLAGHVKYSGVPGAFNRIGELEAGDQVVVTTSSAELTFEIEWVCAFSRETDFAPQIMGYTNDPSVTLITCGGVFDSAAGTHNKRMVARGRLIQNA